LEQLRSFVGDADRKTDQARKRLADTQEEYSGDVAEKAEKVHELAEKIGQALAKAEQLGEEGQVEESMQLMSEIDGFRKEKSAAEAGNTPLSNMDGEVTSESILFINSF